MTPLILFAAGSLRKAFTPLCQRFSQLSGIPVELHFGPAGLLRERIEAGAPCDLFASANTQHPQRLLASGLAIACQTFAFNRLSLTVCRTSWTEDKSWLALLSDPTLRVGTSTPGCDPSGDYTWQLFENIERLYPGEGLRLMQRAIPLVGGRDTMTVPADEIASAWLIRQDFCELFIGYVHYSRFLTNSDDLRILTFPESVTPRCEYQLAQLSVEPQVQALAAFIVSDEGQAFLDQAGLLML